MIVLCTKMESSSHASIEELIQISMVDVVEALCVDLSDG